MKLVVRLDGVIKRNNVTLPGARVHEIGDIRTGEPVRVELEYPNGYREARMYDLLIVCHSRDHERALEAFLESDSDEAW